MAEERTDQSFFGFLFHYLCIENPSKMKRITFCLTFFLLCTLSFAQNKTKIAVMSDIHFLSESLMDNGTEIQKYEARSGKNVRYIPEILDKTISDLLSDKPDILLIPGDLTKDGELQSHLDLKKKLDKLKTAGTRIFVIPGNHDIAVPHPLKYIGSEILPTENISPTDFSHIYHDFGYSQAFSLDSASLSYAVALNDTTWLIAIDSNRYKEYTTGTISSGRILPETENWVLGLLAEAKKRNIKVMGMMHHGLVEHFMFQSLFYSDYLVNDWRRMQKKFADNGMKAIFTGHFHANDITEYQSSAGNKIYDIETGSLSSFPFPYRKMTWDGTDLDIHTTKITSIPSKPDLAYQDSISKLHFATEMGRSKIRGKFADMPDSTVNILAELIGKIYIQHVRGDEVLDENLRKQLQKFSSLMGNDGEMDLSEVTLDFPPADNEVKLKLR